MSIEKRIHRKASDYVAALQNPDAPELDEQKNHVPLETGKGRGRLACYRRTATGHIHLRVTMPRKNGGKCKVCVTGVVREVRESKPPGGFQDWGEYHQSAEYNHEVRGGNELSPD